MHPALQQCVQELREERHHGASWMARKALEGLVEAVRAGEDPLEAGRQLASARVSMGAVAGAIGRVLMAGPPEQVIAEAEALIGARDRAAKAIAVMLAPKISGTVLTHSASATVLESLTHTPPDRVICTISEPGSEGRGLAAALKSEGLAVELIADAEGADAAASSDLVLLGADTVFGDGALVNKIGTKAIAGSARKAGVRVMVACETFKLSPAETEEPSEDTFELISPELIDCVVTEEGEAAATDVAALIDRTPGLRRGYELLLGRRSKLRQLEEA